LKPNLALSQIFIFKKRKGDRSKSTTALIKLPKEAREK